MGVTMLMRSTLFLVLALATLWPGVTLADGPTEKPNPIIPQLVHQLGEKDPERRQAAEEWLVQLGLDALPALEQAAKDANPEVAKRAQRALEEIHRRVGERTHQIRLLDAEGNAIGGATMEIRTQDLETGVEKPLVTLKSDGSGRVALPDMTTRSACQVYGAVSHPDFGRARVSFDWSPWRDSKSPVVPLVPKNSLAYERALKGQVVGPQGEGVRDVTISCSVIRTPGEGLIQLNEEAIALTDDLGHFTIYPPPGKDPRHEHGQMIPMNSRFHLMVQPPDRAGLFPRKDEFCNLQEARIVLQCPKRFHRFRFEKSGGGRLNSDEELKEVQVFYSEQLDWRHFPLGWRYIREGGCLPSGFCRARCERMDYLPIKVTDDSPEELVFRIPGSAIYRGRVVNGTSGQPFAGVFVIAASALVDDNNLATLIEEDWTRMEKLPANPTVDDPALKPLHRSYDFEAIARTDVNGGYELTPGRGRKFFGVVAFARNYLPFGCRVVNLQAGEDGRVRVPDMPLFPAAKLFVCPLSWVGYFCGVPPWIVESSNQPNWASQFQSAMTQSKDGLGFEGPSGLRANEKQPIYVPADMAFQLHFPTSEEGEWTPVNSDQTLVLHQGEEKDIGSLQFVASAHISVTVVDAEGRPVEGIPVRRWIETRNHWWVAHNTDAKGEAHFHVPPGTSGKVAVRDFRDRHAPEAKAPNLAVPYQVGKDSKLLAPCVIRLTDKQIEMILGKRN